MSKKILSILLTAMLMLGLSAAGVSAETADPTNLLILGDSISTGYGLPGYPGGSNSYGMQLAYALGLTEATYLNLAADGATSGALLAAMANPASGATIASKNTIVLSIGSNDILGPFIQLTKVSLGLPITATGTELQAKLATTPNAMDLITTELSKPENQLLFTTAVTGFSSNFVNIISGIKSSNSSAKLYVQSIYNPFSGVPQLAQLSAFTDTLIGPMNLLINGQATPRGYTVLDVNTLFNGQAPLYTNIAQFDVHPSQAGHIAIFNTAYTAIKGSAYVPGNTTVSAAFDKNTEKQADVTAAVNLAGNILVGISNGSNPLVKDTDYTVNGSMVTIKKTYLAQQNIGTTTLIFGFSAGNTQTLSITVSDTTAVAAVIAKIAALPAAVTLENSDAVSSARTAYNALSTADKALVTNYSKLTEAEGTISSLNQTSADSVIAKINAIPEAVTLAEADVKSVTDARAAYNVLTELQKTLVTNLSKLTAAETKVAQLQSEKAAQDAEAAAELPQTGSLIDLGMLTSIGAIALLLGLALAVNRKRRINM